MNHYQRAKEEMAFYGEKNTSLQNLLAAVIGPKVSPELTGYLASLGARNLSSMGIDELNCIEGVGKTTAHRLKAAFSLAEHLNHRSEERVTIRCPEDAADLFSYLRTYNQEHFDVAFLNTKNQVVAKKNIFIGSLNASIVHPREIYREAIKLSAASIIVAHQHPSGDSTPSQEDIHVTKRLVESGKLIGVELLDHVVVGDGNFVSLKEKGYI